MWRFEARNAPEHLRVGRHAVERWAGRRGEFVLAARHPVESDGPWNGMALAEAIGAAVEGTARAPLSILLESAWLPVVGVAVGPLWRHKEVTALVRHRFASYFKGSTAQVPEWEIQTGFQVGDPLALGFGMHPAVRGALDRIASVRGTPWHGIEPALAWGINGCQATRRWARGSSWICWPEQDRLMIVSMRSGKVQGLNSCAASEQSPERVIRAVDVERVRLGVEDETAAIEALSWDRPCPPPDAGSRLHWRPLVVAGSAVPATVAVPPQEGMVS